MEKFALIELFGIEGLVVAEHRHTWPVAEVAPVDPEIGPTRENYWAYAAAPLDALVFVGMPGFTRQVATVTTTDGSDVSVEPVVDELPADAMGAAAKLAQVVADWGWDPQEQVTKALAVFDQLPAEDVHDAARKAALACVGYAAAAGRDELEARIRARVRVHPMYAKLTAALDDPADEEGVRALMYLPAPWVLLALAVLPPAACQVAQTELIRRGRENAARKGAELEQS